MRRFAVSPEPTWDDRDPTVTAAGGSVEGATRAAVELVEETGREVVIFEQFDSLWVEIARLRPEQVNSTA